MSVLCKGIAHPRCHLHTLTLADNVDLRDRGVEGGSTIKHMNRSVSSAISHRNTPPCYCERSLTSVTPLICHVGASTAQCSQTSASAVVNAFILFGKSLRLHGDSARGSRRCPSSGLRFELQRGARGMNLRLRTSASRSWRRSGLQVTPRLEPESLDLNFRRLQRRLQSDCQSFAVQVSI